MQNNYESLKVSPNLNTESHEVNKTEPVHDLDFKNCLICVKLHSKQRRIKVNLIHKKLTQNTIDGDWIITLGNFDGFHLGHQALVTKVLEDARKLGTKAGLITFEPHPKHVLQPATPLPMIYDDHTKWKLCADSDLDGGFVIPFTQEFSSLDPIEFMEEYLVNELKIKKIIVGYDFNFGRKREGGSRLMRDFLTSRGVEFEKLDAVQKDGYTVSSTMIRRLLYENQFDKVSTFLGRKWLINGEVTKGKQLGRELGFPTLNLYPPVTLPVRNGVYVSEIYWNGRVLPAITNIGVRPTLNESKLSVESHLLDFNEDLYGEEIDVHFIKFIREEVRFESIQDLKTQIAADKDLAVQFFKQRG